MASAKIKWGNKWLIEVEKSFEIEISPSDKKNIKPLYKAKAKVEDNTIIISLVFQQIEKTEFIVSFEPFSDKERAIIVNEIFQNDYLFQSITNNKFPLEIEINLRKKKIDILCKEDDTLTLQGDDELLSYKVIQYILLYESSRLIQKDPFLLFQLRGMDLNNTIKDIEKEYKETAKQIVNDIRLYVDLYDKIELPENDVEFHKDVWDKLDFTVVENVRDLIINMLDKDTRFHEKSFKGIFDSIYKDVAIGVKFYANTIGALNVSHEIINELEDIDKITFAYDQSQTLKSVKASFISGLSKEVDMKLLLKWMNNINEKHFSNYSTDVRVVYCIYKFCIQLLTNGAFVPQFIQLPDNSIKLRWIPAITSNEITSLVNQITNLVNISLVKVKTGNIEFRQVPVEAVKTICSVFLHHFIAKNSEMTRSFNRIEKDNKIFRFFFFNDPLNLNTGWEARIFTSIYKWLIGFNLTTGDFSPCFNIIEGNDGFFIHINVKENKAESELIPRDTFLKSGKYKKHQPKIKQVFDFISLYFEQISQVDFHCNENTLSYSSNSFIHVLTRVLPVLRLLGFEIIQPESLKQLVKPQLTLLVKTIPQKDEQVLKISELLNFNWRVAIGDKVLSTKQFQEIADNFKGIVKYEDSYVFISPKELEDLNKSIKKPPKVQQSDLLRYTLTNEYQHAKIELHHKVKDLIEQFSSKEKKELPKNLKAELRPYQVRGYEWMSQNSKYGFGSLIADDMGLGKTLQVITLILQLKNDGFFKDEKCLVIVPTTLLTNWQNEINKFTEGLDVEIYHGPDRELAPQKTDVVITTYRTLTNDIKDFNLYKWHMAIVDEAQNIKNPQTAQTKAVKSINSNIRIAMSGTPVENRLMEYWSIFDFFNHGFLGSQKGFERDFAIPIQNLKSHRTLEKFKKMTGPFIMRRLKTDKDIIKDLPEKIINNQYCSLTVEQAAYYKQVVDGTLTSIKAAEGMQRRGLILKLITNLKQICNHPAHFMKTRAEELNPEKSGKTMLLFSILENIFENNEKTLIFTQYKEMGNLLIEMISKHFHIPVLFLHGGIPRHKRDEMIKDFQEHKNKKVFLLSLKAGGTGLNLTAASNVIHYDLWWNPAVENQATDRAHRIGQTKNVMVYRLLTQNTFEEKIDKIINKKKDLADRTVSSGEKWISEMDNSELKNIFGFQI